MKDHDPEQCLLTFDGVPISGYAAGSFIEFEPNEDHATLTVGADGEATRSISRNQSGRLRCTLMQGSASNDYLSGKLLADKLSRSGVGVLQYQDSLGTTKVLAAQAWVRRTPNIVRGQTAEDNNVEWEFELARADVFVGGLLP